MGNGMKEAPDKTVWHAMGAGEVLTRLGSRRDGLTESESEKRREEFGPNQLPSQKRQGAWRRLLAQFNNLLIVVLLVSGVVTLFLNQWIDAAVIFAVVVINALIGFIQEGKAERALEAIQGMLTRQARVRRDGKRRTAPAEDLVPGDIVYLKSGDGVPADLRLLETKNLIVNEAALTGESAPVEKATEAVDASALPGDRYCMTHSGTTVSAGRGIGVVVETGERTEIGRISGMVARAEKLTTPLLQEIGRLARLLTLLILGLCVLTFLAGFLWRGMPFSEIFLAAVSIAVAAIPEGLPAIITITLAIGVREMAKRRSIIRRLPAVETLGSVTVICSDKTGTLTRNEMTVKKVLTADGEYDVTGAGYEPDGEIRPTAGAAPPDSGDLVLRELLLAGALCNDSVLHHDEKGWRIDGDPTEGALLPLARKGGIDLDAELQRLPRHDTLHFESERRFMATLHATGDSRYVLYVKGAPEKVLKMCDRQLSAQGEAAIDPEWPARLQALAASGHRLLAAAFAHLDAPPEGFESGELDVPLIFLGAFGLIDPPRPEAVQAIQECKSGGIHVKMITGDFGLTAKSIASQLGIGEDGVVLEGSDLEAVSDEDLPERAAAADVFARTSPEHKTRLVRALQRKGEIVAMTGDGVNDAPALKQANVGVAMGIKGTEVARQSAEMVIADDNFASIVAAVKEGRTVYDNIKKAILFILPTNGAQALVLIAAILAGFELPITPVQILWVNLVSAVTLALALAFEPSENNIMKRPPRNPRQPLISAFGLWRISFVSILLLAAVLIMFQWARGNGSEETLARARTVAVNMLVVGEIFYLFNARRLFESTLSADGFLENKKALLASGILIVLQAVYTYAPPAQALFESVALPASVWLYLILAGFLIYLAVEAEKWFLRRRFIFKSARVQP